MINGKLIIWNDKNSLKDFNLIIGAMGQSEEDTVNMGLDFEPVTYQSADRIYDYGAKRTDALTLNLCLITKDGSALTRDQQRAIMRWLDDCEELKWLEVWDYSGSACDYPSTLPSDLKRYYYYCRITSKSKFKANGNVIGFTCDVTCDGNYAYGGGGLGLYLDPDLSYHYYRTENIDTDADIEPVIEIYLTNVKSGSTLYGNILSYTSKRDDGYFSVEFDNDYDAIRVFIDCENKCIFMSVIDTSTGEGDETYQAIDNVTCYPEEMTKLTYGTNNVNMLIQGSDCTVGNVRLRYKVKYKIGEI